MPSTEWRFTVWSPIGVQLTAISCSVGIDPATVRGSTSAFGPSLEMPYTVHWYPDELSSRGAQLLSLEGWIAGQNDTSNAHGVRVPMQVSAPYTPLVVPLTPQQIEVIEDLRRGDAVILKMTLTGLAVLPNADVQATYRIRPRFGGEFSDAVLERYDMHRLATQDGTSLRIEREQWLTMLGQFGVSDRRLVELPGLAIPNQQQRWGECIRRLNEASQYHRRGEFEQTLEQCRKVVEGIATVLGEVWHVPKQSGKSFEAWTKELSSRLAKAWQSDKEAPKLLASLLSAAYTWASPMAHYGSDIPVREEASFGLSAASNLLAFAAQLVNAHPYPVVTDKAGPEDAHSDFADGQTR